MHHTTLIVPGLHGSGPTHWQSWMEQQVPDARRVTGIDWERPVLARWANAVRDAIDQSPGPVWVVAHSFGCLASVVAAADRLHRVAGLMLVAPANPERFTPHGLRDANAHPDQESIARWIPREPLGVPSLVVASTDDPWVRLSSAAYSKPACVPSASAPSTAPRYSNAWWRAAASTPIAATTCRWAAFLSR